MWGALFVILLAQAAPGTAPKQAEEQENRTQAILAKGLEALDARQYSAAAAMLEKVVSADPHDYRTRANLGFAYIQLNRDREAIEQYKEVVKEQPDLTPAQLNLGMLLLRQNQPAAAIPHLRIAAEKKPQDFRAQNYLGEALAATGDNELAAEAYRKALEIDPNSGAAALGLGRCLANSGRLEEAEERYRAAALDPKLRDGLLEMAGVFENAQRQEPALNLYLEYLKGPADSSQQAFAQEQAGMILLDMKKYQEAIPYLEPAVKHSPSPGNQAALAKAYTETGQKAKALPLLKSAAAAEKSGVTLAERFRDASVEGSRSSGQAPAAEEPGGKTAGVPPDLTLSKRNGEGGAERPGNNVRLQLAKALLQSGDAAGAAKEYVAVAEKEPQNPEAWDGLAFCYYKMQNFPAALKALDQARKLGVEGPGNHFLRAVMLDKMHQWKPALESYKKFLDSSAGKDPDNEFKARQRVRIITNMLNRH